MTDILLHVALTIAGSIELSVVVKATVILALALAGARLARSRRASARAVLMEATFLVLLALPVVAVLAPPVAFEFPVARVSDSPMPRAVVPLRDLGLSLDEAGRVVRGPVPVKTTPAGLSVPTLIRTVWALGAALFLGSIALMLWRLRRVRRCGLPWPKGEALVRTFAADAGINRPIDLLTW